MPNKLAASGRWLVREFDSLWPVFLFFLVAFLIQLLIIKLTVAQFSIEITALSKAVVGALLAAKAVLILDETPLSRSLESYRRIIAVTVKTFFYGSCALLLGYLERFIEALRRTGTFDAALRDLVDQANLNRFMAWILGISVIFSIYFACAEINQRMGDGALWSLFFDTPRAANRSDRQSAPLRR